MKKNWLWYGLLAVTQLMPVIQLYAQSQNQGQGQGQTQGQSQAPAQSISEPFEALRTSALDALIEEYEGAIQEFDSVWSTKPSATSLGDASNDRALAAASLDQYYLNRLDELEITSASLQDQITADIFRRQLDKRAGEIPHRGHYLPLNGWWDYHATFAELPTRTRFRSQKDMDQYLEKLRDWPRYNRQYIDRLERGRQEGWVRPSIVFDKYLPTISSHVVDTPGESRFFEQVSGFPDQAPEELKRRVSEEALLDFRNQVFALVRDSVLTGYSELVHYLEETYIPSSSQEPGIGALNGGEAYYQWLIGYYTTLDLTADEIHQIGLREVAEIRSAMMEIVREEGYDEDFDAYVNHLRTDPQYYAETPEQLMEKTALVLKRMDGELPKLFKTLPRQPYGIKPIPDYLAPQTTTAYYSGGNLDTEAGFYAVNTYDLPSRPLYEVESLSLHEAVPGHHLQIALHKELHESSDWPAVRTRASFTAYTEGWALYSERLGEEVGFYQSPSSRFGRLSYDMWRALRLVVDTGLHTKGWTRKEAIDFMASNSALSLRNIENEVDRYIFWPGQALGYKLGEIEIRNLRQKAETELGADFDVREFHEVVLGSGNIPLNMLQKLVEEWIAERTEKE